jgi:hypothetical protein
VWVFVVVIARSGVDGLVNATGRWIYSFGDSLRQLQTGNLRQYVTFIAVGTVAIFVIVTFIRSYTFAGM